MQAWCVAGLALFGPGAPDSRRQANMTRLIVFSGLPGTGKSTLAEQLAAQIGVPAFAGDWLMVDLNMRQIRGYVGVEAASTSAAD